MRWSVGLALGLLSVLFTAGRSAALVGDSRGAYSLDGSFRSVGAVARNYDFPLLFGQGNVQDEYLQHLLRFTAGGRPRENLALELHLVQSLTYASSGAAPGAGGLDLSAAKTRYRAVDDTREWVSEEREQASLWLDRFNLRLSGAWADLTLGRQALTFGKAYFWNPLDVYLPFDARQFDREYKAGVDALRLDVALGDLAGVTLVGVVGRELDLQGGYAGSDRTVDASWYGSSVLARWFTHQKGWDFAVQGGKIYGGWQLGGALVGEHRGLEVRAEAAFFRADSGPALPPPLEGDLFEDALTAVLGLGHRFDNSLTLQAEYLYNGGGGSHDLSAALLRFRNQALLHLGRHLAGFLISYEILPVLVGQCAAIYSLTDSSLHVQPTLNLSLSDNSALLLGAALNLGARPQFDLFEGLRIPSEFGAYPSLIFAEIIVYF